MTIRLTLSIALAVVLGACSSGGREAPSGPGGAGGARAGLGGELIYAQARRLSQENQLSEALRAYRCAAQYGPGYEVAWHQAGVTAFAIAEGETTPEDQRAGYRDTGFEALAMAARTGWGASQAELARQYHVQGETEEAAYWAAVYRANPREDAIGLQRLPPETFDAIRANSDYPAALERAADFFPRVLVRGRPGTGCEDFMTPIRPERDWDLGLRPSAGTSREPQ